MKHIRSLAPPLTVKEICLLLNLQKYWYTGSKATDEKATSSLFVSCLFVGEKVAFLSAQKATMKKIIFGDATGWVCLKRLFYA